MSIKPVRSRAAAQQDVLDAIDFYLAEASERIALDFVDALESAYRHVERAPATGSPRYAQELNLPGLRSWPLSGFPWLVFYFEHDDRIDVWRFLHMARDIPAWMQRD
jgi:toxin ParE1/3/4